MNILNYFIDEFSETFEYLDTEYLKSSPVSTSALACACVTLISTFLYYVYSDWEPYNGYMESFQYKNWAPRFNELRSSERTHTYSTLSNYILYEKVFSEYIWSGHYTKYERFFEENVGITHHIKSVPNYSSVDLKNCRDQPWWWELLLKGLVKYLNLDIYRRYEWAGFRHMYVLWHYKLPLITLKSTFLLQESDVVTRLPKIPPLFDGRVIIRTRDIYYKPERFLWIRGDIWRGYSELYSCQHNLKFGLGSLVTNKNLYCHY